MVSIWVDSTKLKWSHGCLWWSRRLWEPYLKWNWWKDREKKILIIFEVLNMQDLVTNSKLWVGKQKRLKKGELVKKKNYFWSSNVGMVILSEIGPIEWREDLLVWLGVDNQTWSMLPCNKLRHEPANIIWERFRMLTCGASMQKT